MEIEYIIPENPDDRILEKAKNILEDGGLIVIPTDTNWLITASIKSKKGVEKLYKIKKENKQKHFSLLCSDISMGSQYAIIDNQSFRILKRIVPGFYTFIFEAEHSTTKIIQASKTDKEVGIRFPPSHFIQKLISHLGNALISSNITHKLLKIEEDEPIYPYIIEEELRGVVDLLIDPGEVEFAGISTIISFINPEGPELIRAGAGDISFLE